MKWSVHPSAKKHGVHDDDIDHALVHSLRWIEVSEDPLRFLAAGPDRSGNLLELVVLETDQGGLVIHAMPLRQITVAVLFGGEPR
jgi:hypothetical protein